MTYNWKPASTAKGRERLKELLDSGIRVVGKIGNRWKMISMWKGKGGLYHLTEYLLTESTFIESNLSGIEFLDPEPSNTYTNPEIAALKAENERMRNALLDIEADARAKLAANLPLNSNETMHSVKHGLGQLLENGKSGDIGSVIDAIARTFAKDDDFCA